ncbi:LysR family transcriptional regulator [Corynebacterium sp.]|uniref:LysR family transcriptional regulator n=1 Tax=Corynebacterium sp. TaxID=1720 RepID=UPI0028AB6861|nr:LysR family transcriptional regulator [Corynebacterium sp.]
MSKRGAPVTLQQYEYFLSAVEMKSLSAAADFHMIAQPSLSEQIRRMEKSLGVTLFTRTNRELILTDAAKTLIPFAAKAIEAAQQARESVVPLRELTAGTASFGAFNTASLIFYVDLLKKVRAQFPRLSVRLITRNSTDIADMIRAGDLECGIIAIPVDDRGLDIEPLGWSPQMYYWSADPTRVSVPMTIERLAAASLVLPESVVGDIDPTRRRLQEEAQLLGRTLTPVLELDALSALRAAAEGLADTIASYSLVRESDLLDKLYPAPLEPVMRENYAFIRRSGAQLSRGTRVIKDNLRSVLESLPVDAPPQKN